MSSGSLVSDSVFYWFVVLMLVGIGFGWFTVDLVRSRRYLKTPPAERIKDEGFGIMMGMLLGLGGVAGLVKHFMGW